MLDLHKKYNFVLYFNEIHFHIFKNNHGILLSLK